ncbi:hypothetical protein [Escherichia coli]|nr:hypothetical protein [Escherichia coli]
MGCINIIVGVPDCGKTVTANELLSEQRTRMIAPPHSSVTGCLLELKELE